MTLPTTTHRRAFVPWMSATFAIAAVAFFPAVPAFAGSWGIVNPKLQSRIKATQLGETSPVAVVLLILQTILNLLALFTVALILYAGFRWMLSRGNEQDVAKAKGILLGAVLGLVIILASLGILEYVFTTVENITGVQTTEPASP